MAPPARRGRRSFPVPLLPRPPPPNAQRPPADGRCPSASDLGHRALRRTDAPSLTYAGRRFVVGQPVVVHSKLSGQDFAGVIQRIEEEDQQGPAGGASTGGEVLAKLADGTFIRVALSMLQTGRLSLQQPDE